VFYRVLTCGNVALTVQNGWSHTLWCIRRVRHYAGCPIYKGERGFPCGAELGLDRATRLPPRTYPAHTVAFLLKYSTVWRKPSAPLLLAQPAIRKRYRMYVTRAWRQRI
jgi:hypothetical protein